MDPISDEVREAAIDLCLMLADSCVSNLHGSESIASVVDDDEAGAMLVYRAWNACEGEIGIHEWWIASYLEAAALLRDGWCPGDPVTRLKPALTKEG